MQDKSRLTRVETGEQSVGVESWETEYLATASSRLGRVLENGGRVADLIKEADKLVEEKILEKFDLPIAMGISTIYHIANSNAKKIIFTFDTVSGLDGLDRRTLPKISGKYSLTLYDRKGRLARMINPTEAKEDLTYTYNESGGSGIDGSETTYDPQIKSARRVEIHRKYDESGQLVEDNSDPLIRLTVRSK